MSSVNDSILDSIFDLDSFYTVEDINRLFGIVDNNLRSLGALLDTARMGQALFAYNVALAPDVQEGQPVYYDTLTSVFRPTRLQTMMSGGRLHAAPSSEAWGLVTKKCATDRGHLLLEGLSAVDLTHSTGQASPKAKLYLSKLAGLLREAPDDSIVCPALLSLGDGRVLFRPWFADTYPRYIPRQLTLSTAYAASGTINTGGTVTLQNPNTTLAGWLPASHSAFGGKQPPGAKFGYNMAVDSVLGEAWPPLEPELSKLYFDTGGTGSSGSKVLLGSDNQRVLINQDGIWWMSDSASQLPWDWPLIGTVSSGVPKNINRKLVLETAFAGTHSQYETAVSSLLSNVPWLAFRKPTGSQATTGDLQLSIETDKLYNGDPTDLSITAIKGVRSDGYLKHGPVVVGMRSLTQNLTVSGGVKLGDYRYGQLSLTLATTRDMDLYPGDVQLFGATTKAYADTMAIGLPNGRDTYFVASFHVPRAVPADSKLRLYFWLFAPTSMSLPAGLTLGLRRFIRPAEDVASTLPTETELTLNYPPGRQMDPGTYLEVMSDQVTVQGGDTLYLKLSRGGSTDGVGAELQILKQYGTFETSQ